MARDALRDALSKLAERYGHSSLALDVFVEQALKGIDRGKAEHSMAAETIESVMRGDKPSELPHPGEMPVELTAEQWKIASLAIQFYAHFFEVHPQMLLEMSIVYAGALFDAVISDALAAVLRHIPERLRSGRTLTAAEALRFNSRDELIEDLAKREVLEVTYRSIDKQFDYFRTSLGVDVFADTALTFSARDVAAVRERRNLIAHNGGLATIDYVAEFDSALSVGDLVVGDVSSAKSDRQALRAVALALLSQLEEELAHG
jgi:hypothetical protein